MKNIKNCFLKCSTKTINNKIRLCSWNFLTINITTKHLKNKKLISQTVFSWDQIPKFSPYFKNKSKGDSRVIIFLTITDILLTLLFPLYSHEI